MFGLLKEKEGESSGLSTPGLPCLKIQPTEKAEEKGSGVTRRHTAVFRLPQCIQSN